MENVKVTKDGEIKPIIYTKPKNGKFFKQLENIKTFRPTHSGDGYETIVDHIENPDGSISTKTTKVHLYALIQENEGTCSLDFILGEMSKGNYDVLDKTDGKFFDVTKLPQNIYELQEFEKKTLDFYNKNPYIKRLYKTAGDYRKALTANVDIEKQIVDLYRKDIFDLELKKAKQANNGADAPKGDK